MLCESPAHPSRITNLQPSKSHMRYIFMEYLPTFFIWKGLWVQVCWEIRIFKPFQNFLLSARFYRAALKILNRQKPNTYNYLPTFNNNFFILYTWIRCQTKFYRGIKICIHIFLFEFLANVYISTVKLFV